MNRRRVGNANHTERWSTQGPVCWPGPGQEWRISRHHFLWRPGCTGILLNIFAKGDKINMTPAERNELRAILADIVTAYRQGTRGHDQGRK